MYFFKIHILSALTLALFFSSCGRIEDLISNKSDRDNYVRSLKKAGLAEREIVKMWMGDFERALLEPISVDIPYSEQIVYPVGETRADAYLIQVPAGRKIEVKLQKLEGRGSMFLEARNLMDRQEKLGSSDSTTLQIEAESEDRQLILILQPELMSYGRWNLGISHHPSVLFPVEGKSDAAIQSFFGAPRDGGKRLHHGIDIFAYRGTAVLAVNDGWVYRTGESRLGGKIVWLKTSQGKVYYAHLDSILISSPSRLSAGDTLGFVGNTGNAIHTPPHLHFGIYEKGAIDPLAFVSESKFPPAASDFQFSFAKLRTKSRANFRFKASMRSKIKSTLDEGQTVWVFGKSGEWLRVTTGKEEGYLHFSLLEEMQPDELKVQFPIMP